MSMRASKRLRVGRPPQVKCYRRAFVRDVHRVLQLAASRLSPRHLATKAEPAITGLLVQQMNDLVEGPDCPRRARRFVVQDDPPLNTEGREGKDRNRVDIEIVRASGQPRPRFQFEAKRLSPSKSVAAYLGVEGLGCFVSGRYGSDLSDVGMLGYVQKGSRADWASAIEQELDGQRVKHRLAQSGPCCEPRPLGPSMPHTFRTIHARSGAAVSVYHTLLQCC